MKKHPIILTLSFCLGMLLLSCGKYSDTRQANVRFHTAYFNDWFKYNVAGAEVVTYLPFPESSQYYSFINGLNRFKVTDRRNVGSVDTVLNLESNTNYTFLAYHPRAILKSSLIKDDLTLPLSGKAHVRILYAFPGGDTLPINTRLRSANDFFETRNRIFSDHDFDARQRSFTPLAAPGTYQLLVNINRSSNDTVINDNLVNFAERKIYTIVVNANPDPSSVNARRVPPYSFTIITHN